MKPFEPRREDGRSYREVALDTLKGLKPGDLISYETLGRELELDPSNDLGRIQRAVRQANRNLLKLHHRGIQVVENTGYRMLPAREHMLVANRHQAKADRAML